MVDKGRATLITRRGDVLTCCHRIGAEQYVWRYRHNGTGEALRSLGHEAAKEGTFTFFDAALVSAAMQSVRDSMEAQGSATGV